MPRYEERMSTGAIVSPTDRDEPVVGDPTSTEGATGIGPGTLVGRYVLLHALGAGAMGAAFAAYDPELDRKVAIKLVATRGADAAALLSEAQALAKVSHPNVVAAHDAGRFADRVYVVMTLAEGATLRSWLAAAPRTSQEVLRVLLEVGAGLAAAHHAGIAHGDAKPENVVIGADGRAQLTDFRLAAADDGAQGDLFAFGAMARDALVGMRPGERVRRALERCVTQSAEERWPSMDALLAELAPPVRTGARTWLLAAAAVLVAATSLAVTRWHAPAAPDAVCKGAERRLTGVWDESQRAALAKGFAAVPVAYADNALASTRSALDAYARSWVRAHEQACVATRVHAEASEAVLDARMACLDGRRRDLNALVMSLSGPTKESVTRAVQAATSLPSVDACLDRNQTPARPGPLDGERAARLDALRTTLADQRARANLGQAKGAAAALAQLAEAARREGDAGVLAEVLFELGKARGMAGDPAGGSVALDEASSYAERSAADALLARVYTRRALVTGVTMAKRDDGLLYLNHADSVIERLGAPQALRAETLVVRASLEGRSARYEESIRASKAALSLYEGLGMGESLDAAAAWHRVGAAATEMGRYDEAREALERALALRERHLGPDHPETAVSVMQLSVVEVARGNFAVARKAMERAQVVFERGGSPHDIAMVENNLGLTFAEDGDFAHARPHFERALAVQEAALGDHPSTALSIRNLGDLEIAVGHPKPALVRYAAAMAMLDRIGSPNDDMRSACLTGIGRAALLEHDTARAVRALEDAFAIQAHGTFTPNERADTKFALAQALAARGDAQRARTLAEQARTHYEEARKPARLREVDAWLAQR